MHAARATAGIALTLAASLTACAPADHQEPPVRLSATVLESLTLREPVDSPTVAVGPEGHAVAVWTSGPVRNRRVDWSSISPGGSPAPAGRLTSGTTPARDRLILEHRRHDVAVGTEGAISVAWLQGSSIRFRRIGSDHDVTVVLDSAAQRSNAPTPVVAVADTGDAYVAWAGKAGPGKTVARMRVVHPDGTLSPTVALSRAYHADDSAPRWIFSAITLDSRDRALVSWSYLAVGLRRFHVRDRILARRVDLQGHAGSRLLIEARGGDFSPYLSALPDGRALVTWMSGHRIAARWIGLDDRLGPVWTAVEGRPGQVEVVPFSSSAALAAWTDPNGGRVRYQVVGPGGAIGKDATTGDLVHEAYAVLPGPDRTMTLVWAEPDSEAGTTTVRAAVISSDGIATAPTDLDQLPGLTTQLAAGSGPDGTITALWGAEDDATVTTTWELAQYELSY